MKTDQELLLEQIFQEIEKIKQSQQDMIKIIKSI